ncbi:hypothetical protein [Nocardioides sp.]|uniref:hypothetical protein n=1 Tax=Nocardioides sp. TaxID=35761 RepID=UPI0039E2285A
MLLGREDELKADYLAGMGSSSLARKYGVAENTVLAWLKAHDVEIRPLSSITARDVEKMAKLRAEGWTYRAIGGEFGVTRQAVAKRLRSVR